MLFMFLSKKKKSQHKGRSTEKAKGAERQPLTSGPFPSLRHPPFCVEGKA